MLEDVPGKNDVRQPGGAVIVARINADFRGPKNN
jgi:hypothetical protein